MNYNFLYGTHHTFQHIFQGSVVTLHHTTYTGDQAVICTAKRRPHFTSDKLNSVTKLDILLCNCFLSDLFEL